MSRKFRIINNTGFNTVSALYVAFLNFFLVPYLISELGTVEFGLIGIINVFSMLGYISIFDFGIAAATSKFIAEYISKKKTRKINELINTALLLFTSIGILLILILFPTIELITESLFSIPAEFKDKFNLALKVLILSYVYQFPVLLLVSVLEGFQRFDLLKLLHMVAETFKIGAIYYFVSQGNGFEYVIYSNASAPIILVISYMLVVVKIFPDYKPFVFSISALKRIKQLAGLLFMGKWSSIIANNTDRILVSIFLSPVLMSSFEVLFKLPQILNKFLGLANTAVVPVASDMMAQKEASLLTELFHRGFRFYFSFIAPLTLCCIFFAEDFFKLWLGEDFVHLSGLLSLLLIWSLLTPFFFGGNILTGMNKGMKTLTVIRWVQTTLKAVFSFIFITSIGLEGVVYSHLISYLSLFLIVRLYKKHIGFSYKIFFKDIFSIVLTGAIPLIAYYFLFKTYSPTSLIELGVYVGLWCIIQWGLILLITLDKRDKETLVQILKLKNVKV